MNLDAKKIELEKMITDELKLRIKTLGLISSGNLYNSIKCVVILDKNNFEITIESPEYYTYLDEQYNITNFVLNIERVETLITDISTYQQLIDINFN